MASSRRALRFYVAVWLAFQAGWLTALVPRDCCALRTAEKGCHETAPATYCPMRAAGGRPCMMHSGHAAGTSGVATTHAEAGAPSPAADCRLSGSCDGPMSALLSLLTCHGILPDSAGSMPGLIARSAGNTLHQAVIGRFEPPDPRPPRT